MLTYQVVRCLLIEPNPESALNEEAGRLFMEDYEAYAQRARLMTSIHALKEKDQVCVCVCVHVCVCVCVVRACHFYMFLPPTRIPEKAVCTFLFVFMGYFLFFDDFLLIPPPPPLLERAVL